MTGTVKMCLRGEVFHIAKRYSMLEGHTGYTAYTGSGNDPRNVRTYAKDNVHFFGRNGFDESRALNYIANDYVEYLKALKANYNFD